MQETLVQFLCWGDPLEKETATHSSMLAWRIPRTEEPGRLQSMGSQRVRRNWATFTYHCRNIIQHSVQFSSVTQSCPTLCDPMNHSTPGLPVHHKLPELTQTHVYWVSDAIQPSHLLSSPSPPAPIPPSIRVFSNESTLHMRWPKYWSFSFGISPSNEHPGLISFRMDWLDLLVVQGTLKNLLQHHSSKASHLQRSAICILKLEIDTTYLTKSVNTKHWWESGATTGLMHHWLQGSMAVFLPQF